LEERQAAGGDECSTLSVDQHRREVPQQGCRGGRGGWTKPIVYHSVGFPAALQIKSRATFTRE